VLLAWNGRSKLPVMSSESYHEPVELLSEPTKNLHRAIVSLREELEAVDWYQQRAEACSDPELKAVLLHNKNEEIEHAMMALEWLRRNDAVFASNIDTYLKAKGPITEVEEREQDAASGAADSESNAESLGIGSLRAVRSAPGARGAK
jgi:ferritin-like protein